RSIRQADVELLVACQHERGIPTWQDIHYLREGPTEDQIASVLENPSTACAVLWLTPEVAGSSFLRKVEVPRIVSRFDRRDEFFVVTVAAGGLDYDAAANIVRDHTGLHDFSTWNICRVGDPIELS